MDKCHQTSTKVSKFTLFQDDPDTVPSQASWNKPFGHHTDTKKLLDNSLADNHNDAETWSHSEEMRILTHCLVRSVDGSEVSDRIVKIRHGIPGPKDKDNFCELVGHFSSKDRGMFTAAKKNERIYSGGEASAHMQMWGSQGQLHHWIEGVEEDVVRIIHSPRQLIPFQGTEEIRSKLCENAKVIGSESHDVKGVLSLLCQSFGGMIVTNERQTVTQNQTTKASTSSSTQKLKSFASAKYPNGPLEEPEKFHRAHVIGMNESVKREDLALS